MLADDVEVLDDQGNDVRDEMPLAQAFFNPLVVEETGVDPIMKYRASSNAEEIDNLVVDGVRNFLFGPPGAGGFDLASLNIQRGRDHGLADYNSTRAAIGLPKVTSFSQITSDPVLATKLQSLYGSVDNTDLWVAGLAEDHVRGSNIGPTFQHILVDQFTRLRDGDRFWYERDLNYSDLTFVRNTKLSDIIKADSGISNIQSNVFYFDVQISGRIYNDRDGNGHQNWREYGTPGITVQLVRDEDSQVVDTTLTDRYGNYRFTGVQIGDFTVRPVLPAGWQFTTVSTSMIDVTRGMRFTNTNFGVRRTLLTSQPIRDDSPSCNADSVSPQQDGLLDPILL
jgi:peroxidase